MIEDLDEVRDELGDANGGAFQTNVIQSASGPPTADQLYQIDRSWSQLPSIIERINGLITTRTTGVLEQVYQASVRPEAARAIQMPRR